MKPLAGGAIEDATLALRFCCANPNMTVVIPGMAEEREIAQNIAAVNDTAALTQAEQADMQIVLQNTIRMLRELNLEIVVEGVETKEQVDLMTNLNCDYIQGYHFSKPLPKTEFITFIQKHL